jgi:hypothetical protein
LAYATGRPGWSPPDARWPKEAVAKPRVGDRGAQSGPKDGPKDGDHRKFRFDLLNDYHRWLKQGPADDAEGDAP